MAPPDPSLTAGLTAEALISLRDVNSRLDTLDARIEQFGAIKAGEVTEQVLSKIRRLKDEVSPSLEGAKEYFEKFAADMENIAKKVERDLEQQVASREIQLEGFKKAINSTAAEMKKATSDRSTIDALENLMDRVSKATTLIEKDGVKGLKELRDELLTLGSSFPQLSTAVNRFNNELTNLTTGPNFANFQIALENILESASPTKLSELKDAIGDEGIFKVIFGDVDKITEADVAGLKFKLNMNLTDDLAARMPRFAQAALESLNETDRALVSGARAIEGLIEANAEIQEAENQQKQRELFLAEGRRLNAKSLDELSKSSSKYLDSVLQSSSQTNVFGSALLSMATAAFNGKSAIGGLASAIGGTLLQSFLSPEAAVNRLFNFLNDKLIKSAFEFDKLLTDVNKQTGGMGEGFAKVAFAGDIFKASAVGGMAEYGLRLKDFSESYVTLSKNVGNFNNMLDSNRKLLAQNAAELKLLGVSAENYAKLTSVFMGAFSKDAAGANDTINKIARDAIALNKDIGQYTNDLQASMNKLVGYGKEATQVFKELAAISQATKGVVKETDLTGLADKFATFDSASQSVANLNVLLKGTALSALDLMGKDPSEVIMKIKRATTDAGLDFEKLNIGYKKLLAEYFGGDISKAAAFFKMNIGEAQEMMSRSVATEEELKKKKEESAAAQDKLNAALDNMKVALTPIIDLVAGIAKFFIGVNKAVGPFGTFLVGLAPLLFGTFVAFRTFAFVGKTAIRTITMEALQAAQAVGALKTQLATGAPVPGAPGPPGAFKMGGIGVGGAIAGLASLAIIGGLTYAASKQSETPSVKDGLARIKPDGTVQKIMEIKDNDFLDVRAGYETGPLNRSTGFINNTFTSAQDSASSFFSSIKETLTTVSSAMANVIGFSEKTEKNNNQISILVKENAETNKMVERNSAITRNAMSQTIASKETMSESTREAIVAGMSGGDTTNVTNVGGATSKNIKQTVPTTTKLEATFNLNLEKLVGTITEEVMAKVGSKVGG